MIKIRHLLSIMVLGVLLTLLAGPSVAAPPLQTPEPPGESPEEYPFDLKEIVSRSAATIAPIGEQIDVAINDSYDEQDPAVALCAFDQYLVVYERDNEIYGQRLTNQGSLLGGAFLISGDEYRESKPDVACEWAYNRFIVVWEHDYGNSGDFDIRARGVYGGHQTSGSQLYGSQLNVSQDDPQDEQDPAIACNSNDHTCLVAFEYDGTGNGDIYGQRVSVGSSDISTEGGRFNVSGYSRAEYNPDIAWGGYDDDYLVVWQYLHNDPSDHYRVLAAYVWDTNQASSQIETEGTYLISPGTYDHHQTVPAAAYNRDTRQYLVVFQYDYWGDSSDYDIKALRLTPGGGSSGSVFSVASTGYHEKSPAVAFSGGPESLPGMGADQFLVTYIFSNDAGRVLYGQAVKGTYDAGGSQLDGDPAQIRSTASGPNFGLYSPDVTGSVNNGRYMVVWGDMTGGFAGDDYDVLGRMVTSGYTVYLPLVLNNYSSSFGFLPNPDGYGFANYGNSHNYQDDLGVADLINMFGAGQVCASGSTPADCTLTAAAEAWRQQMINFASGGHCEGMAATSLRFFKGQAYYTGNTTPGDFQAGAQRVYDLALDQSIENYIAYYFVLQDVQEVWYPTGLIRVNNTPKQILELLRQALADGSDPYTMGIYKYDNGNLTMGHAITPYSVVDQGGGIYWLYVYDNNYPGVERIIVFNTNSDTWNYTTDYQGDASTHNLDLTRISYRNQEPFTCPFAVGALAVEFFLTDGGDMLITNAEGQRIGYNPATGRVVNEIPDAQVVYLKGAQSPMYRLPLQEASELYDVTVSGQTVTKEVNTNLVMVGPGYVVGFEDIQLQPGQNLVMSLSADGRQLVFEEGQIARAPKAFAAINDVEP